FHLNWNTNYNSILGASIDPIESFQKISINVDQFENIRTLNLSIRKAFIDYTQSLIT
ncbi:TPR-repeat-containing protein, partial [Leptospira ellinghausenii]